LPFILKDGFYSVAGGIYTWHCPNRDATPTLKIFIYDFSLAILSKSNQKMKEKNIYSVKNLKKFP
jgi:hypothetical protein